MKSGWHVIRVDFRARRDRILAGFVFLLALAVYFADVQIARGFMLPVAPFVVPILIATYFLSSATVAGVTAWVILLQLVAGLQLQASGTMLAMYTAAVAIIGLFGMVAAGRLRNEAVLESDRERLLAEVSSQANEAARERDRLGTLVNSIADEVWFCDAKGKVSLLNDAAWKGLGFEGERAYETLPELVSELEIYDQHGRPRAVEDAPLLRSLRGEIITGVDESIRHLKTGELRYRQVSSAPIRNEAGDIVGAVAVVRDITAAREVDRFKDQFVVVASHELKTPLTIMKGYSQLLLRAKYDLPAEIRSKLEAIDRGADRLNRIVADLVDISRLTRGELKLTKVRVDLTDLAQEVIRRMARTTTRHRITLLMQEPVVVLGDIELVKQVLVDLIDNAVRYSPEGGDIDVDVCTRDEEAVIAVEDRGVGIPSEKQKQIFERFYRAHTGTTYDYGGMGVGLYMAKEIVSRHGGRIWFESREGQGSSFYISLPLARDGG